MNTEGVAQDICIDRGDRVPVTSKVIEYCEGKFLSLTIKLCIPVVGTVGYHWTYLNDPVYNRASSKFTVPDTGYYEIVITVKGGPVYKDTFHLKYAKSEFFEIITNPLPLKCEGVPLTLMATKSTFFTNYQWFTTANFIAISRTDTIGNVQTDTTYIVTALDRNGCLVADTFQVVQSPFVPKVNIGSSDTSLCEGEVVILKNLLSDNYDHYWNTGDNQNSITVTKSGKYWLTVKNTYRCLASDTINVNIIPKPKILNNTDFYSCFGSGVKIGVQLSSDPALYKYEWTPNIHINDNKLSHPTVSPPNNLRYKVRIYTSSGCTDTTSFNVFVNPEIIAVLNSYDTSICLGKSITIQGKGSGGTPGTLPSPPYSYFWKLKNATISNTQNLIVSPLEKSLYTLIVKDAKSCTDSAITTINISKISLNIVSSKNTEACEHDTVQLQAKISGGAPPYSYQWVNNANPIGNNSTSFITLYPRISGISKTILSIKDLAGCWGKDSLNLNINPIPVFAPITNNLKICVDDTINYPLIVKGGSGDIKLIWNPQNNTIFQSSINTIQLLGLSQNIPKKELIYYATDSKNCHSKKDTLKLETVPNYKVNLGNVDTSNCLGKTVLLSQENLFDKGLNFSWTKNDAVNVISSDSIIFVNESGQYTLTIKNPSTGCNSFGTKTINFIQSPSNLNISSLNSVCNNSKIFLKSLSDGDNINFKWEANNTGTFTSDSEKETYYSPNSINGIVDIKLTAFNSCGKIDTIQKLIIKESPIISINQLAADPIVDSSINFQVEHKFSNLIKWNFNDGSILDTGFSINHTFTQPLNTTVFVTASNTNNCYTKDSLKIIVKEGIKIKEFFIPNVFSPFSQNLDNNTLKIFGKNISENNFSFKIYNKWGEVIYHTINLHEAKDVGWNGNFLNTGHPVNVGTYTYTVKGQFSDGTPIEKAGSATLLK